MYTTHYSHAQNAVFRLVCVIDKLWEVCPLTPALVDGPGLLIQVVRVGLAEVEPFGVWHRGAVECVGWVGGPEGHPWGRQSRLRAALGVPLVEKQHGHPNTVTGH